MESQHRPASEHVVGSIRELVSDPNSPAQAYIDPVMEVHPTLRNQGLRFDTGKARYDLVPPDALDALVQVYTKGAEKYAPRNWEKGMAWSKCFGPLMRHAWKYWRGEDFDQESGQHHMAHVAWNAMALLAYSLRGIGEDDRAKLE